MRRSTPASESPSSGETQGASSCENKDENGHIVALIIALAYIVGAAAAGYGIIKLVKWAWYN